MTDLNTIFQRLCLAFCIFAPLLLVAALGAVALWRRGTSAARRSWVRVAFAAALALPAIYLGATKPVGGRVTIADDYIADAGSYLTNDVAHIEISKKSQLLPDDTEILVYARECSSSNATDWVRLSPHLTYADHPYDYALPNATNYNVMVAASFTPTPTVHTNGVWVMRGFEVPSKRGTFAFGNTKVVKITPWENPYITDGLVAMWDGEWNAGGGKHDPNATYWVDLISGEKSDTFTSVVSVGSNYLSNGNSTITLLQDATDILGDVSAFQVETVGKEISQSVPANAAGGIAVRIHNIAVASFRHNAADAYGPTTFCDRTTYGMFGRGLFNGSATYPIASSSYSVTNLTASLRTIRGWYNGSELSRYNSFAWGSQTTAKSVGINSSTQGRYARYSIRIYNRALTDEEREHNLAVDRARFNLP